MSKQSSNTKLKTRFYSIIFAINLKKSATRYISRALCIVMILSAGVRSIQFVRSAVLHCMLINNTERGERERQIYIRYTRLYMCILYSTCASMTIIKASLLALIVRAHYAVGATEYVIVLCVQRPESGVCVRPPNVYIYVYTQSVPFLNKIMGVCALGKLSQVSTHQRRENTPMGANTWKRKILNNKIYIE